MLPEEVKLKEIAPSIAVALGAEWKPKAVEPYDHGVHLDGPGEMCLWLSATWAGRGRYHVGGMFPAGIDGENLAPSQKCSITVSQQQDAKCIARHIRTRLLTVYQSLLLQVIDRKVKDLEAKNNRLRIARELAALAGTVLCESWHSDKYPRIYLPNGPCLEIRYNGDVCIDHLTLTEDQARRILPILLEGGK
jgi:hypothetical protein